MRVELVHAAPHRAEALEICRIRSTCTWPHTLMLLVFSAGQHVSFMFKLVHIDCALVTAHYRLRTIDYALSTTHYRLQIAHDSGFGSCMI